MCWAEKAEELDDEVGTEVGGPTVPNMRTKTEVKRMGKLETPAGGGMGQPGTLLVE